MKFYRYNSIDGSVHRGSRALRVRQIGSQTQKPGESVVFARMKFEPSKSWGHHQSTDFERNSSLWQALSVWMTFLAIGKTWSEVLPVYHITL